MKRIIRGSRPRSFPVGVPQCCATLRTVYGQLYEGQVQIVPEGETLIIPEHGGWESSKEIRHEFSAGTQFRVIRNGDQYTLTITEVEE